MTSKFPSGFHVTAALQCGQNSGQAVFILNLHLVLIILVNHIAEGPGGGSLHRLFVTAQQPQELLDPT